MNRIVIKVGSNVLTRSDGRLDVTRMSAIVDQIAALREKGHEIILVSSGAVASGKDELKTEKALDSVARRQLFSSVGQVRLMNRYYTLFREYGIHIGQVLTMKENFSSRTQYLNQRGCMEVMLDNGVLPIVNENDTASLTELMFTDNDELSGLIASMMDATTLIILSNIDGIYNGSPKDPASTVIPEIGENDDLASFITAEKSGFGRGGMITKCRIARKVASEGIRVIIANGRKDNILLDLLLHPDSTVHTEFTPSEEKVSTIKKWIAHSDSFSKGVITLNDKAVRAVRGEKAVSILPVGVTAVEGDFEEGDIVTIADAAGKAIGVGRVAYGSDEARAGIGVHDMKPIVHYDYLYLE
jgi:glutamate 5-kinase